MNLRYKEPHAKKNIFCHTLNNMDDVDYAVYITPEGEAKVMCVDPEGIREGHNE